jgi:hypothetical protein
VRPLHGHDDSALPTRVGTRQGDALADDAPRAVSPAAAGMTNELTCAAVYTRTMPNVHRLKAPSEKTAFGPLLFRVIHTGRSKLLAQALGVPWHLRSPELQGCIQAYARAWFADQCQLELPAAVCVKGTRKTFSLVLAELDIETVGRGDQQLVLVLGGFALLADGSTSQFLDWFHPHDDFVELSRRRLDGTWAQVRRPRSSPASTQALKDAQNKLVRCFTAERDAAGRAAPNAPGNEPRPVEEGVR